MATRTRTQEHNAPVAAPAESAANLAPVSETPDTPTPTPTPKADPIPFARKSAAQQRAQIHNAVVGDANQARKLEAFWRERGQVEMAAAYRDLRETAERVWEETKPIAPSAVEGDDPALILQCVRSHAKRHANKGNWGLVEHTSDADLQSIFAGAKTIAGAIAKVAIFAKTAL